MWLECKQSFTNFFMIFVKLEYVKNLVKMKGVLHYVALL